MILFPTTLLYSMQTILLIILLDPHADFDGSAFNIVKASNGSAVQLVKIIIKHFSRFRDTAIYKGRLVHFYKRAQVC